MQIPLDTTSSLCIRMRVFVALNWWNFYLFLTQTCGLLEGLLLLSAGRMWLTKLLNEMIFSSCCCCVMCIYIVIDNFFFFLSLFSHIRIKVLYFNIMCIRRPWCHLNQSKLQIPVLSKGRMPVYPLIITKQLNRQLHTVEMFGKT